MNVMLRTATLLLIASGMGGCSDESADVIVGTLERDRLELTAETNEPIVAVLVKEGDAVQAGAVLLQLDAGVGQARLDQATAEAALAERRLAELVRGPRAQEILEARAGLEAVVSSERTASNEFGRIADLVERGLLSASQLDSARAQRDAAASSRKQAQARLELLLEGTRREAIEQAEAELKRARSGLIAVQTSLERHTVKAPRSGRIEALPFKLGERAIAGSPVVVMLADDAPYARAYVPEALRAQFLAGTNVSVSVDGVDRSFMGVARFVSAHAQFTPYYALTQEDRSRLSYLAEFELPEAEAASLPSGIPVQVRLVAQ